MSEVGKNINNPPRRVRWKELERASDSAFRSTCPACNSGVLLVRRCLCFEHFSCFDRCTECGQVFIYEDEEILGTHVLSIPEMEVHEVMVR